MFRISKIECSCMVIGQIYLKGYNFLTNGEKKGSLTFYWGKKREIKSWSTDQLFFTSQVLKGKGLLLNKYF